VAQHGQRAGPGKATLDLYSFFATPRGGQGEKKSVVKCRAGNGLLGTGGIRPLIPKRGGSPADPPDPGPGTRASAILFRHFRGDALKTQGRALEGGNGKMEKRAKQAGLGAQGQAPVVCSSFGVHPADSSIGRGIYFGFHRFPGGLAGGNRRCRGGTFAATPGPPQGPPAGPPHPPAPGKPKKLKRGTGAAAFRTGFYGSSAHWACNPRGFRRKAKGEKKCNLYAKYKKILSGPE